jgi:hypothetical protein
MEHTNKTSQYYIPTTFRAENRFSVVSNKSVIIIIIIIIIMIIIIINIQT